MRNRVQPAAKRRLPASRFRLGKQNQECRLENIIDIASIREYLTACGQHCLVMPLHESLKCLLVVKHEVTVEKIGVSRRV
jgi:hypothetical protein